MTPTDETTEDNKASRMMRRAILHELLQPFDPDPPPPVDICRRSPAPSSSRRRRPT